MTPFIAPRSALGEIDAEAAASIIAAAADIALILDESGVIRDVSIAAQDLAADLGNPAQWRGQSFADVVTDDSRQKAEALVSSAASGAESRWRHVNHRHGKGPDIPILYAGVRAGVPDRIVLFGRDLRAVSSLQRRLTDAQQALERDHAHARLIETRYRLLFQMTSDAVLVVDTTAGRVIDSNPTARRLFGASAERGADWRAAEVFTPDGARAVAQLMAGVRASGRADDVRATLASDGTEASVSVSPFRDGDGLACLVRVTGVAEAAKEVISKLQTKLLKLMERAPDGFVVTSDDGHVMVANAAFVDLVQAASEDMVRGESLERWIGRAGVDLDVMIANLRQRGSVRLFATRLRDEFGESTEVEVSAVTVMNGGRPCFGFAIRDIGRRIAADPAPTPVLPRSLENMTKLIGRVALKDLVREATDVIERLCIEAALELTGDNRASAAEMLGLSRQSLYVKLRRYGLGDAAEAGAD